MGYDVHKLVPFGGGGTRADMGQTRGAQSGEADRHAVWLAEHNLEPKMSPYDPTAMLDEIQRLVPGYDISRLGLLAVRTSTRSWCRSPAQPARASGADAAVERHAVYLGHVGTYSPQTLNTVYGALQRSAGSWRSRAGYDPMARMKG